MQIWVIIVEMNNKPYDQTKIRQIIFPFYLVPRPAWIKKPTAEVQGFPFFVKIMMDTKGLAVDFDRGQSRVGVSERAEMIDDRY